MSQGRPAAPEPSEIAGRYQIVQKLGAGAFGTVYKAKDRVLKRMVAIKTIRLEGLAAASTGLNELLERFKREAEAAANLKHPNILTIYDFGEAEGLSYLAMEFIDGHGLDKIIASEGRLPLERAANIAAQVADALDFAHKGSVVHRDIKPANIMIEAGNRVKVADFGIAKITDAAEHLTATGGVLGTPSYMSPEQARGTAPLDGRSDLFAVGCVLYEMLAGTKAFRGESLTAIIFKIVAEEPPPIREAVPDLPDEMVRIIAKAMAKNPEARYQTGRELAQDLLALTQPGSVPTVRQSEVATTALPPGSLAPATVKTSSTLQAAAPTLRTKPPATPVPDAPPVAKAPPRPASPPPPVARPAPPPAARRTGGGAGLVIGIGVAGLLLAGLAAAGGWYFFLRKPAETQTAANAGAAAGPSTGAEAPSPSEPVAPTPAPTLPPPTLPPPTAGPARATVDAAPPRPAAAVAPAPAPNPAAAPSFLDEEQEPAVDGRQAGEQLAGKYRSPQGGGSSGSYAPPPRFRARPRSPVQLAPHERPAVATLRHVINAEESFLKKHGRYGSFAEMATAQTLFLDVPRQGGTFQRAGYRFELALTGDGFRVTATPTGPGLRPFHGDDSGYILAGID